MVALHSHPVDEVLRVTVDDDQDGLAAEVMEITAGHPVYVEGKGWVKAEALALGDRLRRADGGWAKVLALERVTLAAPQMVYNLTVRGIHTYFVLEVGVLVHNCGINPATNFPSRDLEFFHGTTAPKQAFDKGIDISRGGGQLGPGFYVTPEMDVAILHTQYKSLATGGNINILKFTIPGDDLNKLNIITLERKSSAFEVLTDAAKNGTPIPKEFQYLIDDYDAIWAPLRTPLGTDVWQLKFNPKAGEFLNRYPPKFETLY